MNNILITSAGQRVSLVKAFKKEIVKVNSKGKVFTVDLNPILAPACHVSDGYKKVERVNHPDYISNIITICNELNVSVIIPTIDTELLILSENKEILLKAGIIPIVSGIEFVKACRDKRIINNFFVEK